MAESWKGKTRGGVLGHKIFVWILSKLGLGIAYFVLIFVAFYFVFFSPKSTKSSYFFFNKILKQNPFTSFINIYRNYYVFGQTLLDKIAVMAGLSNKFSYNFDGEHHLIEMDKKQTGGILISAHIGNWEIAGNFLDDLKSKINIVMFDEEHEKIKDFLEESGKERKFNVIPVKQDFSHIIKISKALKNKEFICMHGDRFVEGGKRHVVDFMGKKAPFPLGPFHLTTRFKVPYSFVFAIKETNSHYHFFASPGKVHEGSPEELLELYAKQVEKKLKTYPRQWFNYYDFWEKEKA